MKGPVFLKYNTGRKDRNLAPFCIDLGPFKQAKLFQRGDPPLRPLPRPAKTPTLMSSPSNWLVWFQAWHCGHIHFHLLIATAEAYVYYEQSLEIFKFLHMKTGDKKYGCMGKGTLSSRNNTSKLKFLRQMSHLPYAFAYLETLVVPAFIRQSQLPQYSPQLTGKGIHKWLYYLPPSQLSLTLLKVHSK